MRNYSVLYLKSVAGEHKSQWLNPSIYTVLEISKGCSKEEVKKAYRKQALKNHPDKVPVEERPAAEVRFKAAQEAYDILYDDDKRHLYDTHGMSAFNGSRADTGMGAEMDMEDIMNMFGMGGGGMGGFPGMGGMGGGPQGPPKRPRKGRSVEQEYELSLEDAYKGKSTRFTNEKNVVCPSCEGKGGKEKTKPHPCGSCDGRGVKQRLRQVGPMVTQETVECGTCEGTGEVFKDKDRCKKCKGKRVISTKKLLDLYLPPGSKEGDKIVLAGEADQLPEQEPGDIVFVLKEVPHEVFQRSGPNLKADLHITLAEALTGFNRVVIKHLDGRGLQLQVTQPKGKILRPGQLLRIVGEGMPVKKQEEKGDLFLEVVIDFPEDGWIKDEKTVKSLQKILPKPKQPISAELVDEIEYEEATEEELQAELGADWEDDDDDEDGGQPQCATQ